MRTGAPVCMLFLLVMMMLHLLPSLGRSSERAGNRHVGVKRCERCHNNSESGLQVQKWKSYRHANAMKTLLSPDAKKVAAERGVSSPAEDDRCVRCHETGHGKDRGEIGKSFETGLGVQCESCHGPGERHFQIRFEEQQDEDEFDDEEEEEPEVLMSLPPGELARTSEDTCKGCHNEESPTYKPFCYCERRKEIAHWDPRREKARGSKALGKQACVCK